MSGGTFDYEDSRINGIVVTLQKYIDKNIKNANDRHDNPEYHEHYTKNLNYIYSDETIKQFEKAVSMLKKGQILAHRIDWLIADDDGEDTFHKRLKEDLTENEQNSTNRET